MQTISQTSSPEDHSYKTIDEKILFLSEQLDLHMFDNNDTSKSSLLSKMTNKTKNRNIISDWNKIMPFAFELGISIIPPSKTKDPLNLFNTMKIFSTTDENKETLSSNEDPHVAIGLACITILERKMEQKKRIESWLTFGQYFLK
ncbi:hypothetical protein [Photobacterium kishitanii]|uniref:Uncharacterized protein n=1 Tax=Photobacterium kishitanii TaxID=318456 RepID=A0A2T3KLZ3_9GAMM|nr:hypothetical protein [Photobacterium kishitanii]PSV00722.1 hypothetical protein C9J27_06155 [Photobacterium kishitanii]